MVDCQRTQFRCKKVIVGKDHGAVNGPEYAPAAGQAGRWFKPR